MAAHTQTDTASDLLPPGLAVFIPPTVAVTAETPNARCNLLTVSDHLFTAGVGLIFYVSILWLAFKLKKLVGRHMELQTKHLAHYELNVVDHFFGVCLWITLFSTIYLRLERGTYVVLVLPCHYLTSLLLAVVYCKKKDHPIFMIYLYAHWQGYYAILFADMTWYVSYVEVFFFWAQHLLLAIVPLYYLFCTDRFRNLPNSFFDFISIYAWTQVYHGLVIIPGAFIWTQDLNSMLCRPAGLEITGTWWREVVSLSSMASAFFMTYVPKALADIWHSYGVKEKRS